MQATATYPNATTYRNYRDSIPSQMDHVTRQALRYFGFMFGDPIHGLVAILLPRLWKMRVVDAFWGAIVDPNGHDRFYYSRATGARRRGRELYTYAVERFSIYNSSSSPHDPAYLFNFFLYDNQNKRIIIEKVTKGQCHGWLDYHTPGWREPSALTHTLWDELPQPSWWQRLLSKFHF